MKVHAAHCDNCGAPLEIPVRARRTTCLYCESSLEVVRRNASVTTTGTEGLERRLENTERELERRRIRERLRKIDDRWVQYRSTFMRDGHVTIPTRTGAKTLLWIGLAVGGFAGLLALDGHPLATIGIVGGVFCLLGSVVVRREADRFEAARQRHWKRRSTLSRKLRSLREAPAEEPGGAPGRPTA